MRHVTFEDRRTGKSEGDYFKVAGTKDRPQRIAYIPAVAHLEQLVVSPELQRRVDARDPKALEEVEDIQALREQLSDNLNRQVPSAEKWADGSGKQGVLYAKMEVAKTFWVEGIGYVFWKDGLSPDLPERPPQITYGFVILEYELDVDNEVALVPPGRQVDLGGGHKLPFRYSLKSWSLNDAKIRAWKEHSRNNPVIRSDYSVWTQKEGNYERTKFSPAGPAVWRQDPVVMQRVIREAAGMYANLRSSMAKDFQLDELVEMLSGGGRGRGRPEPTVTTMPEEVTDFASLLGWQDPPAGDGNGPAALEHQVPAEFPPLDAAEMERLIEATPSGDH